MNKKSIVAGAVLAGASLGPGLIWFAMRGSGDIPKMCPDGHWSLEVKWTAGRSEFEPSLGNLTRLKSPLEYKVTSRPHMFVRCLECGFRLGGERGDIDYWSKRVELSSLPAGIWDVVSSLRNAKIEVSRVVGMLPGAPVRYWVLAYFESDSAKLSAIEDYRQKLSILPPGAGMHVCVLQPANSDLILLVSGQGDAWRVYLSYGYGAKGLLTIDAYSK